MKIRPPLVAAALLLAPLAAIAQSHPWQARLLLADVQTQGSSSTLSGTSATLDFSSGATVGLGLSYTLLPEWSVELSAQRSRLDVDVASPTASTFNAGRATLGIAALTVQYHFFTVGRIRPYVGAGAHLASISGFKASQDLVAGNVATISFDSSASVTAELGVDYDLTDRISINADATYHDVGADAALILPSGDPWEKLRVDIDPWVLAIGVGFRF
jgi:outer membrane protein W